MARRKARMAPRASATRRLEVTWKDARNALRSAEGVVEKRWAAFARSRGIDTKRLAQRAELWRTRLDREGRKARKFAMSRLAELQHQARQRRRSLTRVADDAVTRTLAVLNIPTHRELQQLLRRVDQLSTRVGAHRR